MAELPGGTVTLVFTDIEGSTRLLNSLGPAYQDALDTHRRLLREAFSKGGSRSTPRETPSSTPSSAPTTPSPARFRESCGADDNQHRLICAIC